MHLGKITFSVENIGGVRWLYCRPVANNIQDFDAIIGICHVVYVEKVPLVSHLNRGDTFTTYAIFHTINTPDEFDRSYCKVSVTPITEKAFIELNGLSIQDRQMVHAFAVLPN